MTQFFNKKKNFKNVIYKTKFTYTYKLNISIKLGSIIILKNLTKSLKLSRNSKEK